MCEGATIYAAILKGDIGDGQKFKFEDCTAISIGTDADDGRVAEMIPKNTPFPTKVTKAFKTTEDD